MKGFLVALLLSQASVVAMAQKGATPSRPSKGGTASSAAQCDAAVSTFKKSAGTCASVKADSKNSCFDAKEKEVLRKFASCKSQVQAARQDLAQAETQMNGTEEKAESIPAAVTTVCEPKNRAEVTKAMTSCLKNKDAKAKIACAEKNAPMLKKKFPNCEMEIDSMADSAR